MPFVPADNPKCPKCGKSVYAAEERVAGGYKFHKSCFKCGMCNKMLDSTNCTEHEKELFCKNCHGRKYGPKGYGFGGGAGCLSMDSGSQFKENGDAVRNGACLEPRVILKAPEGQGCPRCGGWVYAAEQMLARGRSFHKECFKCGECAKRLDSVNCCEGPDKDIYCKVCYAKRFGPKGYGYGQGGGTLQSETYENNELAPKTCAIDTAKIQAPPGQGCPRCGGVVFAAELVLSKGREWHHKCFKCKDCTKTLDSIIACDGPDKDVYCKTCYGKKWGPHGYGFACGSGFLQTDGLTEEQISASKPFVDPSTTTIKAAPGQGCPRCGGAVFAAEQQLAKGTMWHKKCFNCAECHRPLDSTLACDGPDREIHCRSCYAKLFGPKGKSGGSGGDARSALLQSIQKGAKLKKTTTVDKSVAIGAGRVADTNGNSNIRSNSGAPSRPPPPNNGSAQMNGTPKLKGIFEGLSSMPKLKPVGGRTMGVTSPTIESPSSTSAGSSPQNTSTSNLNGTIDFSTELSRTLMMKKQIKPAQQQASNTSSEMNTRNRGPPPQPPSKSVTDNNSSPATANSSPLIKQSNSGSPPTISSNGANLTILPNKSTLYGNSNNVNTNTITMKMTTASTIATTNKVVPNHGKPNCAPKPPGIQNIVTAKNGLSSSNNINSTTNNGNSNRPIVSRAHSMRSPRSPPITVAGPSFPATQQHFGTIRGAPAAFVSQDAINSMSMRPAPTISRPTVAPPRPPIEAKAAPVKEQAPRTAPPEKRSQGRTKSPPPPPIRSISNTNLSTLPLSIPASAMSPNLSTVSNTAATFGGSASNVSTLMNNTTPTANTGSATNLSMAKDRSPSVSTNNIAPPLPPHRAPPPPMRGSSIAPSSNNTNNNNVAPPVPQRHSSMRNSNGAQATIVQQQTIMTVTPNATRTAVTRFVVDLDSKFGHSFHNVTEFPAPSPFTKFEKSYPSRNMKATTETRKARAPSPPSMKSTNTAPSTNDKFYLQLNPDVDKYYNNESSYC